MKRSLSILVLTCYSALLSAEVIVDNSLGGKTTELSGPDYLISPNLGRQQGPNLFHSFERFNLNSSETATFSGSGNIQTVISRVTGGMISTIDGMLRSTIPNADFYFLNPAGIIFGPQASLDIQGAFHASTANYLKLADGFIFPARVNPNDPEYSQPLLSAHAPQAFGFLDNSSSALTIHNNQLLTVPAEHDISFTSNQLILKDSLLRIEKGRIQLATLAQAGEISFTDEKQLQINDLSGNIQLHNSTVLVDVVESEEPVYDGLSTGEHAAIEVQTGHLELENSDLQINTQDSVERRIGIKAQQVTAHTGSRIVSNHSGNGTGGEIVLQVTGLTHFSGENANGERSGIVTQSTEKGGVDSIRLSAENVHLFEGASLQSINLGTGQGGTIQVLASGEILLSGSQGSSILTTTQGNENNQQETGEEMGIQLSAAHISLKEGAQIGSVTLGNNPAGNLSLSAEQIELAGKNSQEMGSRVFSLNYSNASGKVGNILLNADRLYLRDYAQIQTDTLGSSDQGGNIVVDAGNLLISEGSSIDTFLSGSSTGGNIFIEARQLKLDAGEITTHSEPQGEIGHITVQVADRLIIQEGKIKSLGNSSRGGNLKLSVPGDLYLVGKQVIMVGDFGNPDLTLRPLFLILDGSQISASTGNESDGNAEVISTLIYNFTGKFLERTINASAQVRTHGVLIVTEPSNSNEDFIVLTTKPLNAEDLLKKPCSLVDDQSSFMIVEREGVPNAANDLMASGIVSLSRFGQENEVSSGQGNGVVAEKKSGLWILATSCNK